MSTQDHTPVRQELSFAAEPAAIYEALMDSKQHGELTGAPAEVSREIGGPFSCHDGVITGRNIELVENRRIVQAWRVGNWEPGVYSVLRIELEAEGGGTKLTLEHAGFPAGQGEHLGAGWHQRYWEPLKKRLA